MTAYLLATYSGDDSSGDAGQPPSPEAMQDMMSAIVELEAEMDAAGAFVFGGALHGPDAATVVRSEAGGVVMTDGPFVEAKEHIAGFYIIEAADLDAALEWAQRVSACIGGSIEVSPFAATGRAADHMGQMPPG